MLEKSLDVVYWMKNHIIPFFTNLKSQKGSPNHHGALVHLPNGTESPQTLF